MQLLYLFSLCVVGENKFSNSHYSSLIKIQQLNNIVDLCWNQSKNFFNDDYAAIRDDCNDAHDANVRIVLS